MHTRRTPYRKILQTPLVMMDEVFKESIIQQ